MSQAINVFKFGGASVKDAIAVRNLAGIVGQFAGQPLVVVVSAMGKMTNALEGVVNAAHHEPTLLKERLSDVATYHRTIIRALFDDEAHPVYSDVESLLGSLEGYAGGSLHQCFDQAYDHIVAFGELISTTIISHYLNLCGTANQWTDARDLIVTDESWRNGQVDWPATREAVAAAWRKVPHDEGRAAIMLTQGFIARSASGSTTTLGREGSDFTAAILAWSLDAGNVTIWKDVPGLLNADPKHFPDTVRLEHISYEEAIELAYYGATVIHPKTIKPLQNKQIRLWVKSFLDPQEPGSVIGPFAECQPDVPSYIFKTKQILISIAPRDFSFIAEKNLEIIFGVFGAAGVRINLMQNSAISFSVCVDEDVRRVLHVIEQLKSSFRVRYNDGLQLITIRRYNQEVIDRVVAGRQVLVEQRSRLTAQLVVKESSQAVG